MNIMLLSFFTVVNNAGGAARIFCDMANHFSERGHLVYCVCNDKEKGLPFYPIDEKCNFFNLDESEKTIKVPRHIRVKTELVRIINQLGFKYEFPKNKWKRSFHKAELIKYIKEHSIEYIICYDLDSLLTVYEGGISLSQLIYMVHVNPKTIMNSLDSYRKNILRHIRYIQVLLPEDVEVFRKIGYSNVCFIGNPVSQYTIKKIMEHRYKILNISRIEPHKGQDKIIKAFAKIAQKYPMWQVELWGGDDESGKYTQELMELIQYYSLDNQVALKGKTMKVENVLETGSIFVFPSDYEGFGLALAEAMSKGLPCIGYRSCHGVNSLIQDGVNGVLCDDGIEDLSHKLELLIQDNRLREKLGRNAHESMKQYAPNIIWKQWDDLLDTMKDPKKDF